MNKPPLLLVAADSNAQSLYVSLRHAGCDVIETGFGATSERLHSWAAAVGIVYCRGNSHGEAIAFISRLRDVDPLVPVVIIADPSTEVLAVAAIKAGVNDYFAVPLDVTALLESVRNWSCPTPHLPNDAPASLSALVGESATIRKIRASLARIAASDTNVLITGETGTGKELVARLLHDNSRRRHRPFVSINCAAIPDGLLESELFGCERGAFTGADSARAGHLTAAAGGTVLLDEIGEMTAYAQAKILRALDTREICRLGSTKRTQLDIRVAAATNLDLDQRIEDGRFRRDLYYRLNVSRICLPPLRERREDIPVLLEHCIAEMNRMFRRKVQGVTAQALQLFLAYTWPGNVREIRNVVESAFVDLPARPIPFLEAPASIVTRVARAESRPEERDRLVSALAATHWNVSRAARQLQWSRMTLYRKLAQYQLARHS